MLRNLEQIPLWTQQSAGTDLLDQYFRVDSGLRQLGLHFRERLLFSPGRKNASRKIPEPSRRRYESMRGGGDVQNAVVLGPREFTT